MITMKKFICFFSIICLTCTIQAMGNEAGNGMSYEQKLTACGTCHGAQGDKPISPDYPILAGQHKDYLANSLYSYMDGRRNHPIMNVQVKVLGLTKRDIDRMSVYFSKQKSLKDLAN